MMKQSIKTLLKILFKIFKVFSMTVILLIVLFFVAEKLYWLVHDFPKNDEEETSIFKEYKSDFEMVNSYILENFDVLSDEDRKNVIITPRGNVSIYNHPALDKEMKHALYRTSIPFNGYDYSFIEVTKERVSYGGEGYRMYVYSRNGKAPSYYYYEGDGMHPEVCILGDGWYLLKVNFR